MKTLSYGFDWLRRLAFFFILMGIAGHVAAKTYTDNGDGTVTDPTTGLVWMRCAMGQTWDGTTCTGTVGTYTFDQANALTGKVPFSGQSDWRLPNIRELLTIVDRSEYLLGLDLLSYPHPSPFWSASAYFGDSQNAWYGDFGLLYFGHGPDYSKKSNAYRVRLVRAGQSFNLLDVARPTSDYVDHADGTVTHTPTGLMWQRCAVGQTFNAAAGHCTGTADIFTSPVEQISSNLGGHTDWRLPTLDELYSLVDYTAVGPALNTLVFPDTTMDMAFRSNSVICCTGIGHWYVNVYDGSSISSSSNTSHQVRLVRAGTLVTTSTTTTALVTTTTSTVTTTTTQAGTGQTLTLSAGWNLLGNGWNLSLPVASVFGDAARVTTVWKWDVAKAGWQFYSPTMTAPDLQNYATGNGYGVLSSVGAGEGFWVNAKQTYTVTLPSGTAVRGVDFQPGGSRTLAAGWNLIAIGEALSASGFNSALSILPPAAGVVPQNLATLWAWDNSKSQWYFYSPQFDTKGSTSLTDYIASKGYLDFTAANKLLDGGTGFWVNKPSCCGLFIIGSGD